MSGNLFNDPCIYKYKLSNRKIIKVNDKEIAFDDTFKTDNILCIVSRGK